MAALKQRTCRAWHAEERMIKAFLVILLCTLATRSLCRPNGAPREACSQLIPQHSPFDPMAGTGPFSLDVNIPNVAYDPDNGYECMRENK